MRLETLLPGALREGRMIHSSCSPGAFRAYRRTRKLAIGSHFEPAAAGCPKSFPPRCPHIADSIDVSFANVAAHKQMFLGTGKIMISRLDTDK